MAQNHRAQQDAGAHPDEPGRGEAAAEERRCGEPRDKERKRITRVARGREVTVMRQLADRREGDDRERAGKRRASQKKRRAPRKSLMRTGTMRTSLAEFGASIIWPPPMYIATWPTIGCS